MAEDKPEPPAEENVKLALSLVRHMVAASAASARSWTWFMCVNGMEIHHLNSIIISLHPIVWSITDPCPSHLYHFVAKRGRGGPSKGACHSLHK